MLKKFESEIRNSLDVEYDYSFFVSWKLCIPVDEWLARVLVSIREPHFV